jgi:hypothetical protein
MALAIIVGARLLAVGTRLPYEVVVVLGVEVVAATPVADVAHHLMPVAVDISTLRQIHQVGHGAPSLATTAEARQADGLT